MRAVPLCTMLALGLLLPARHAAAQALDGAELYRANCRSCHGATGTPSQTMARVYKTIPTFADSMFMRGRSEDSIVAVLQHGAGRDMKSFKDKLSAPEMAAVAHFVSGLSVGAPKAP